MAASGAHNDKQKQDRLSTIPRDILAQILNKLDNVTDLVQCGAVCKRWQSILLENHPFLTGGVPLLLLHARHNPLEHVVLDITTNRLYRLTFVYDRCYDKCIIGSSFGWLVIKEKISPNNYQIHLLNPITGAHISLPPVNTNQFMRVILSSDPTDRDCTVMAICGDDYLLCFCKVGDEEWTTLGPKTEELCDFDDLVYHKGQFYAVTEFGAVVVCDLGPDPKVMVVAPRHLLQKVLHSIRLASLDDKLLMIIRDRLWTYNELLVYGLDVASRKWEVVKSLGDRMLFLGEKCSNSISISANEMHGCKPNCIYFANLYLYDLEDKKVRMFSSWDQFLPGDVKWITLPAVF